MKQKTHNKFPAIQGNSMLLFVLNESQNLGAKIVGSGNLKIACKTTTRNRVRPI